MCTLAEGAAVVIRIDEIWLATEPLDMRAGPDTALARVVKVFGTARPHCAYLFANRRGNRMKGADPRWPGGLAVRAPSQSRQVPLGWQLARRPGGAVT